MASSQQRDLQLASYSWSLGRVFRVMLWKSLEGQAHGTLGASLSDSGSLEEAAGRGALGGASSHLHATPLSPRQRDQATEQRL